MPDADLERLLARAIAELPDAPAPDTLLPRVLAAVDARRQRPWYAQPWSTWPPLHQACVVTACLLLLVAATTFAMPVLLARVSSDIAATSVGPIAAMVDAARAASRVISTVTTLAATIAALWRALCGPLVVYASVVLLLLGASLGALGTGLHHLAYRRVYS